MEDSAISPVPDVDAVSARLRAIERRLEALEQWQSRIETVSPPVAIPPATSESQAVASVAEEDRTSFDLALLGRTLIVLGGAFLLRALTESGRVPVAVGVAIGFGYAITWSLLALRDSVPRASALWHGVATVFTAMPLVFEATRRFHVFNAPASALALTVVTGVLLFVAWRRRLEPLAWTVSLMAVTLSPMLMLETRSMVPFLFYLTALGIAVLWLGYELEWTLLRWVVAFETDIVLFVLSFLIATGRLPGTAAQTAIGVAFIVFAAYLASFAVRTLVRHRDPVPFELAQTAALLALGIGGAMWVAAARSTLEVPLAAAMIALGAASYVVSFAFIPRRFSTPRNFVFYSSLGLLLIVCGGGFIAHGLTSSVVFSALAVASVACAVRFRKSSLALHAAVFLCAGFVGAGLVPAGVRALLLQIEGGWPVPSPGMLVLLVACIAGAAMRPIERQGSFELWTVAKVAILVECGWIAATLLVSAGGRLLVDATRPDAAWVAIVRTAVLAGLTILTAWGTRFRTFSPGRYLCNALMIALGVKLVWEDFRVARPATLFVSLAIVGAALILTPRFRRRANAPEATGVMLNVHPAAPPA